MEAWLGLAFLAAYALYVRQEMTGPADVEAEELEPLKFQPGKAEPATAMAFMQTLTALVVMVVATRGLRRGLWLAGAALLAVVVGKLFLLDLANSGTVERIVSFLGVGVLLMIIGYLAPVPPGDTERQSG